MFPTIRTIALLSFAAVSTVAAQGPGGSPAPTNARGAGAPAARMLLAHTGELDLTDAQVVKLAAIARRVEARNRTMRAAMDSARARFGDGRSTADSAARRQFRDRMRADLDRAREQARTDQRDAITVLTPDQQARAWEMASNRGRVANRGMRPNMQRGMRRPGGMRREFQRDGAPRDDMPRPRRSPAE